MKVERASEMDSLVWMRVKIWSTMPILAPSDGTKLPMCARNTIRPTCIEQEYYQCSRKFSLLYPHYLRLHNSFSSPAHVSLGPILLAHFMLCMFQTADLHDDNYFTYIAKQLNNVTFLKRHRASISQVLHFVLIIVWPCE